MYRCKQAGPLSVAKSGPRGPVLVAKSGPGRPVKVVESGSRMIMHVSVNLELDKIIITVHYTYCNDEYNL